MHLQYLECIFALVLRAISSAGSEHLVYTEGVGGSNPSSPTIPDKFIFFEFVLFFALCERLLILDIFINSGFISAVRTFLFSNWNFFGNIEPIILRLPSISETLYWYPIDSSFVKALSYISITLFLSFSSTSFDFNS